MEVIEVEGEVDREQCEVLISCYGELALQSIVRRANIRDATRNQTELPMTNSSYTVPLYNCSCSNHVGLADITENSDGELYCTHCYELVEHVSDMPADWVCVALYDVRRCYGGPEEGGWYYDHGQRADSTIRCFEVGDFPQVETYIETLKARQQRDCPNADYRIKVTGNMLAQPYFPDCQPSYS
jgi:hypothetical protein